VVDISMKVDGIEYKSKPFLLNVVDTITVNSNSIRTILVSDKDTYRLQDTIILSLYQYSKFSEVRAQAMPKNQDEPGYIDSIALTGKSDTLKLARSLNVTPYEITGIENIEEYPEENLELIDFKWNRFDEFNQTMEKLDGEEYIKSEVFRLYFLANKKGTYTS